MFNPFRKEKISTERIGEFQVEISRKKIKNLYLKVSPISQKVRVSVPIHVPEKAIEHFVVSRADWIKKQLAKKSVVPKVEVLNFISGETHFYKGKPHQLEVISRSTPPKVELFEDHTIVLQTREGVSREKKEKALNEWYRASLKEDIPKLIAKWEPVMQVSVKEFGVKRMKTRWGTCNIRAQRIWLSLELAKKSPECLEYVVVHEMVHLLERLHNKRFHAFMDLFLPDWRERKKELNGRIC
tara:strand:+ start:20698 stop:21420 length:723 start_codon:yes stop_codon:yes gene_type:complete